MAADKGYLWQGQTPFEETTDCFMSEVMEVEIGETGSVPETFPRQSESVGGDGEHPIFRNRLLARQRQAAQ